MIYKDVKTGFGRATLVEFGKGDVFVNVGIDKSTNRPCIKLENTVKGKQYPIGVQLDSGEPSETDSAVILSYDSLESVGVLRKALNIVAQKLRSNAIGGVKTSNSEIAFEKKSINPLVVRDDIFEIIQKHGDDDKMAEEITEYFGDTLRGHHMALAELVYLKQLKDTNGKTGEYVARQGAAWDKAFKIMGVERNTPKRLVEVKVHGAVAAEDLEFDGMPVIKKGEPLNDLFHDERNNRYILFYGPMWLLDKSSITFKTEE